MISGRTNLGSVKLSLKLLLASSVLLSTALGQSGAGTSGSPPIATAKSAASASRTRYQHSRLPQRATHFYQLYWGVDSLTVKSVESGEMIRFTYRVTDADRAKPLNDKKIDPFLIDERARVKLVVPSLEKVGQLRQSNTPEAGRTYWMAFSNKGRLVRPGDRVNVVIGNFRANGLVVQ